MIGRREALRVIRKAAYERGRAIKVTKGAGKGLHIKVQVGSRRTTVPKTVSPALLKAILKQLDLKD